MGRLGRALVLCGLIGLPLAASAGSVDDMPSCYQANAIRPAGGIAYDRLVYVLIDQTVGWNRQLEDQLIRNVNRLLTPGTKFSVVAFSAFSQGHYLQVVHTGILEKPLPPVQRENTPIPEIRQFEHCIAGETRYGIGMADGAILGTMQASTDTLDQSDIMDSLRQVSRAVGQDPAVRKVVLVASDGLENSAITSFYGRGTARLIDPAAELRKARAASMGGDFGGAPVYWIGGGLLAPARHGTLAARNGYRSPQILHALSQFWHGWFARSNARLMEFGEPALVIPAAFGPNLAQSRTSG